MISFILGGVSAMTRSLFPLILCVLFVVAGSGFSAAQVAQPPGPKKDQPAPTITVPKAKPGQGPQAGPATPGAVAPKVSCFDEAAYAPGSRARGSF